MNSDKDTNLVWIDLEMSGLDFLNCRILEIATIITDQQLKIIAEGPELIIHQPQDILDAMDDWNTKYHAASGLTQAVQQSTLTQDQAQQQTLEFIQQYTTPKSSPLCGNTIFTDKIFLELYMPDIIEHLHYRTIDVSTIKTLYQRWQPDAPAFEKAETHRALDDIKESIEELKFYRNRGFIG